MNIGRLCKLAACIALMIALFSGVGGAKANADDTITVTDIAGWTVAEKHGVKRGIPMRLPLGRTQNGSAGFNLAASNRFSAST